METRWLALAIGNSRLHWAEFANVQLQQFWQVPHLMADSMAELPPVLQEQLADHPELWIVSVVPQQNLPWQNWPNTHWISLDQIPLRNLYPTLGLDRAVALWGAIATYGGPVLVIDAGTGLTFTAAGADHQLLGGAILPGLQLQVQALGQGTAALPTLDLSAYDTELPPRWAHNTPDAIASGILYTVLAGIRDFVTTWQHQFPARPILLTGGDGDRLHRLLQTLDPLLGQTIQLAPHLIFQGIQQLRTILKP